MWRLPVGLHVGQPLLQVVALTREHRQLPRGLVARQDGCLGLVKVLLAQLQTKGGGEHSRKSRSCVSRQETILPNVLMNLWYYPFSFHFHFPLSFFLSFFISILFLLWDLAGLGLGFGQALGAGCPWQRVQANLVGLAQVGSRRWPLAGFS